MTDSKELLANYVSGGSEPAFRELVERYLDLVHSAAFRLLGGDSHLADDVAQTVFLDLARQARTLSNNVMLGGWLHRHTCFVAAKALRTERRRRFHERQAAQMTLSDDHWEANLAQVKPFLDDAINRLGADDRAAILLRFFEKRDFRSVGAALGCNEDAAQKRVSRALEKLRQLLNRRGVALSAAGLGAALSAEAVSAAPVGLAVTISAAATTGATAGVGVGLTFLQLLTMTHAKLAAAGLLVAAGIATPIVFQQQANARARTDLESLRQQAQDLDTLRAENARLSKLKAQADALADLRAEQPELVHLREQATASKEQDRQLASTKAEVAQLRAAHEAARTAQSRKAAAPGEIPKEVVPRESWAFAGFATPEAGLQSAFWAMLSGDRNTLLATVDGPMRKNIQKDIDGKSDAEFFARAQDEIKDMTGIGIIGKQAISDDEVLATVFITKTSGTDQDQWIMKRIDGDWKIYDAKPGSTPKQQ